MKMIKSVLPKTAGFFLVLTLLCGVAYPLAITGIAKVFFPAKSSGTILVGEDGIKYGSSLLGQPFSDEKYLWGRVMNPDISTYTGDEGEPLLYGGASNKSPAGEELEELVAKRVEKIRKAQPEKLDEQIPVDLVTVSGSGLDPDISSAAAEFQVSRIAAARGMAEDDVREIIRQYTTGRSLGVFGEPRVNVLKVNLALDGIVWSGQ